MQKHIKSVLILLSLLVLSSTPAFAIKKVAAHYNVMEFHLGVTQAQGSYDAIGVGGYGWDFLDDIDADSLYKNSVNFGFNYGRLVNNNMLYKIGFSYANVKHQDEFSDGMYIYPFDKEIKLRLYEISINWDYYFTSPLKQPFAPYIGLGFQAGLLNGKLKGYDSESDFVYVIGIDFGADLTVWKSADQMSSLALSSANNYQFQATNNRPRYLTIGGGLKYFFRP